MGNSIYVLKKKGGEGELQALLQMKHVKVELLYPRNLLHHCMHNKIIRNSNSMHTEFAFFSPFIFYFPPYSISIKRETHTFSLSPKKKEKEIIRSAQMYTHTHTHTHISLVSPLEHPLKNARTDRAIDRRALSRICKYLFPITIVFPLVTLFKPREKSRLPWI